jgi:hypothetical protein
VSGQPEAESVLTAPVLMRLVCAMSLAWEPDWAVAMSHAHRDMADKDGKADVLLGWVTYLARRWPTPSMWRWRDVCANC